MPDTEISSRAQAQKTNIEKFEGVVDSPIELDQIYSSYLVAAFRQKNNVQFFDDVDDDAKSEEIGKRILDEVQLDPSLFDLADSLILQTIASLQI